MENNKKEKNDLKNNAESKIVSFENTSNSLISSLRNILQSRFSSTLNAFKSSAFKFGMATLLWSIGYMNFSALWIVIGVFVSVYVSEKARKNAAATMLLRDTMDDSKTLVNTMTEVYRISGKDLPSWIYLADVEQAEWLNKIIQKLWPYVGRYADELLTKQVQKSIQDSSLLLRHFTFTGVKLGEQSPRVAGVKVRSDPQSKKKEIVVDMQIIYDGDCDIDISVGGVSAGIRDIKLRGLLRVELKPLIDSMPLVGAVSFGFVNDPILDFDLTELGNILDFPGVNDTVRGAVIDSLGSMMVFPEKYIMQLSPNVDISRLRFPLPEGVVRIHVIEAKDLVGKDGFLRGKSDPYVAIKVGHSLKYQTKTIDNSNNPKWEETFEALVRDHDYGNIEFNVFDHDGPLVKPDHLGRIEISLKSVYQRGFIDEKIKLNEAETGELSLRLEWFDLSCRPGDAGRATRQGASCAVLVMYINKADNLPVDKNSSLPSPYLKIELPGMEPLKTQIDSATRQPTWEENFSVFLTQPHETEILFRLKDKSQRKPFIRSRDRTFRSHDKSVKHKMEDDKSGNNLGILKLPVKDLVSVDNMMMEDAFVLEQSKAVLHARFTLRFMKAKPASSSASSDGSFTVTHTGSNNKKNPPGGAVEERKANRGSDVTDSSPETRGEEKIVTHNKCSRVESNILEVSERRKDPNDGEAIAEYGRLKLRIGHADTLLVIHVDSAENLIICDEEKQTSDPYVKVYVNSDKSMKRSSKVVKNNLNPVFNERMEFEISLEEAKQSKVILKVKNQTRFFSSEKRVIGVVDLDLSAFDLNQSITKWYNLQSPDE